jgi:hypothetical protein
MLKKTLCVVGLGAAVCAVSATSASADTGAFGGSSVVAPDQSGLVIIDAPLLDLRCAAPWFGSAVLGASLPIGMQSVVCDEVKAPISQTHTGGNGLL